MQSASSRIWTRVIVSISYDNNHYTMSVGAGNRNEILFILPSWQFSFGYIGHGQLFIDIPVIYEDFRLCIPWRIYFGFCNISLMQTSFVNVLSGLHFLERFSTKRPRLVSFYFTAYPRTFFFLKGILYMSTSIFAD